MFLGPEASQESLKKTQEPPKKHPKTSKGPCKKLPKKIPKNASMVKNALSRRSHFISFFDPAKTLEFAFFKIIFTYLFVQLFRKMLKLILEPSLGSERPKRAKMSPKEPSGASKNQKPSFTKTLKNQLVF